MAKCDYFNYLIIKTHKSGRVSVVCSSDSYESAIDFYLSLVKEDQDDINAGLYRYDLYRAD